MKKENRKFIVAGLAVLIVVCVWVLIATTPKSSLSYSQEYTAGTGNIKGDVDVAFWTSLGEEFEIGANDDGYAVFKTPRKALWTIYREYGDGIKRIKKGTSLGPFFLCYSDYSGYAIDIPLDDPYRKEASIVSRFADIYENSF